MDDQTQFDQQNMSTNCSFNDLQSYNTSQATGKQDEQSQSSMDASSSNPPQLNGSNDPNQGQKRHADQNQNNFQQKRMRTDNYNNNKFNGNNSFQNRAGKVDLRVLLPSKDAGAIIGRGGANIKKLRADHKTIIQVPDCDGPERLLLIGGDTEAAISTILDIIPLIEENSKFSAEHAHEFRLLVHQSQAGCIIGRSGDKIKELRLKHNLDMKVYSECAPMSTERICQMRGKAQDIVNCLRDVLTLLENAPPKGMSRPYDPHNFNEFLSSQYGGYVNDKRNQQQGGNQGPRNQGQGNYNNNNGNNNQGGHPGNQGNRNQGGGHRGGSQGGGYFQNNNQNNQNNQNNSMNDQRGGGRGGHMGRGGGHMGNRGGNNNNNRGGRMGSNDNRRPQGQQGPGNRGGNQRGGGNRNNSFGGGRQNNNQGGGNQGGGYNNENNNNQNFSNGNKGNNANGMTNQVTIPNDLAGAIIGPKGQKIQQIRDQSGAGITIDKPMPGNNDRIITITGTQEQIQNAQYLLQMTVKQSGLWQGQ